MTTEYWITTDFFTNQGQVVRGPFETFDLAAEVRRLMEELNRPKTYAIESKTKRNENEMNKVVVDETEEMAARNVRFPRDGGYPINASIDGYARIPWFQGTLTLVAQSPDGQVHYAKTKEEKRAFAWSNFDWILVCWPGRYTQDIFLVDDIEEFRRGLGFKPVSDSVFVDEDGDEWELTCE